MGLWNGRNNREKSIVGPTDWFEAAKTFGPTVVCLGFFTWWSFIREKALARRLNGVAFAAMFGPAERGGLMDLFSRSWKTTWAGVTAAFVGVLPELYAWANNQPVNWRMAVIAAAVAFMGISARDKNVSSEQQAGIKTAETLKP